jgi:UDP-N-acetylmuramate-alanine ligase
MSCPVCGSEIKSIPAGISKKSGKPYPAFQICSNDECKFKPVDERGRISTVVETNTIKPKKDEFVEGKEKNTRLMSREHLMSVIMETFGKIGTLNAEEIKVMFNDLWTEIEK